MVSTIAWDEIGPLLRLTLPIFLSLMSFFGLSMTELIVAGHLGTIEFTAVAFSQLVLDFTLIIFTQGFNKGLDALASQAFGAKNYALIGLYTQKCCICLTLACFPIAVLWWYCADALAMVADISPQSIDLARVYARLSIVWLWPRLMFQAETVFFQVQQIVLPSAVFSVLAVIFNALLSVSLVYGVDFLNFSGIGFIGCPISMIITQYSRLIVYTFYMTSYRGLHRQAWAWSFDFLDLHYFKTLVSVGAPLMLGQAFENAQFQTMAIFASMCSEISLDAHNATMQLVFFLTSPIYGLQNAGVNRIGMYLGAGDAAKAKDLSHLLFACIVFMSVVIAIPWMLSRHYIGMLYSNDQKVVDTMANITIIAAGGYVALSVFYYSMAVLRSQARALPVMAAFVCGAWLIGVPSAYALGIAAKWGIVGVWIGMALGYLATTTIGFYYVYHSNWSSEAEKAVERSAMKKKQNALETTKLL
ncbi:Multidrug/Oligosaccharidyl-lipid/Polysaccharide (MOP) Flippase Superfamily [Thraustotheca clavata]|uniref:Multidrug/Oligosaccharidyl-lipid/Polysaccharide (MOP) Flippase Superfamily n=1 Tax=Thraustotheca clavata TaxID=74557 RepID=A0A1V9ZL89_9STRA|nr:Multidrug/Oligosaccharidyl-lipid/Polysaccharide (MOP) Flippase Superfamily [Thraustotheca clavata]